MKRRQSKNSKGRQEAGTEVEPREEHCLLTCFPRLSQQAFFHHPEPQAQGWHHWQWARTSHINHWWKNCPEDLPTYNLMETSSQLRFLFPESSSYVSWLIIIIIIIARTEGNIIFIIRRSLDCGSSVEAEQLRSICKALGYGPHNWPWGRGEDSKERSHPFKQQLYYFLRINLTVNLTIEP